MDNLAISVTTMGRKNPVLEKLLNHNIKRLELGRISPHHLNKLEKFLITHPLPLGVHAPLPRPANHHSLTHGHFREEKREKLLKLAARSYAEATHLGANYIIFHLPLYNEESIRSLQRQRGSDGVRATIRADCHHLCQLSRAGGPPVYLEIMYLDQEVMTIDFVKEVLVSLNFGLCLDLGHFQGSLHRFPNHSLIDLITEFLPYVKVIHLYNTQGYVGHDHRLPHPSQKPEDDWIDLPRVLSFLRRSRPDCLYVLEYSLKFAKDPRQVEEGINWVKQLLR